MKNNATCPKCGEGYVMGWNGTVDGCDECTGIVRDSKGRVWEPGKKHKTFLDISTGKITRVSRRSALNPKPKG